METWGTVKGLVNVDSTQHKKSLRELLRSLNILAVRRRQKAERLLLQSFKECYPRWEKEGLVQKPKHFTATTKV